MYYEKIVQINVKLCEKLLKITVKTHQKLINNVKYHLTLTVFKKLSKPICKSIVGPSDIFLGNNYTGVNFKWMTVGPEDLIKAAKQLSTSNRDVFPQFSNPKNSLYPVPLLLYLIKLMGSMKFYFVLW